MTDLKEQLTILVALQGVEMEIIKVGQHIVALNDEASALGDSAIAQEGHVSTEKEALDRLKKAYRDLEAQSKEHAASIEKSNTKLRAVKTNKEYQSTLKEIEELQKKNSATEDQMIELLDQIESQEDAVKKQAAELARFIQTCNQKKNAIVEKIGQEEQTGQQLQKKKEQIRTTVDSKIMAIFDDVKTKVRGMAVVPVQQEVCMGCHMNIPPQLYNELLRYDELRFCPHCHRIIYWKEKEKDSD